MTEETTPGVHETRKRWDARGGWCAMRRVGSGIVSLYRAFVHVKGSLIPRDPSYDSLWIITQRTRRANIYVRARSVNVARCPAYIVRLCFHTYFSNAPRSIILDNSSWLVSPETKRTRNRFVIIPLTSLFLFTMIRNCCLLVQDCINYYATHILRTILTDELFFSI